MGIFKSLFGERFMMPNPPPPPPLLTVRQTHTLEGDYFWLLMRRLRVREGECLPFNHITIGIKSNKDMVVFIIKDDTPLVLEDGAAMFPSDELVNKINLLR